jgi:hypothetical protein
MTSRNAVETIEKEKVGLPFLLLSLSVGPIYADGCD